jgi:hypothetical protein
MTRWTDEGTYYGFMHFTDKESPLEDSNMMARHYLLDLLCSLKVLEYDRGYDGIYHDIIISKRLK